MKRKKVLGLDLGQSTGWAVFVGRRYKKSGTVALNLKEPLKSLEKFRKLLSETQFDSVIIEDVGFVRYAKAHASYWRVRTLIEVALDEKNLIPSTHFVAVTALKKWATGKGNATKIDMVTAARDLTGEELYARDEILDDDRSRIFRSRQEDQADAILCAAWGLEHGA